MRRDTVMNLLKSLIVWVCFIPVAVLNGGLREYVLVRAIGEKWALPVSGVVLSVCIFLITWLLLPRIVRGGSLKSSWQTGMLWALLTMVFEVLMGLASGSTPEMLLEACNPLTGNLWMLVLATTLFSPVIVRRISGYSK